MFDWSRLRFATSTDDSPTPFYILKEVVDDVDMHLSDCDAIVAYLLTCIKSASGHVKLKSLLVIKQVASKVDLFRKSARTIASTTIKSLASLPPALDQVPGFEGSALIRKAAEDVITLLATNDADVQAERARIEDRIHGYGTHTASESQPLFGIVTSGTSLIIDTVTDISTDLRVKGPVITLKEATLDVADMVTEGLEIVSCWMRRSLNTQDVNFPDNYRQQSGNQFASFLNPPDLLD